MELVTTGQLGTVREAKPGWPGGPERTWVPGACEGMVGREARSVGGLGGRKGSRTLSTGCVWPLSAGGGRGGPWSTAGRVGRSLLSAFWVRGATHFQTPLCVGGVTGHF